MSIYFIVYFLFIFFGYVSSENISQQKQKTKILPVVDVFISRIENDANLFNDEDCVRAMLDMLRGVKNNTLWAVWAWESMQPPVGSMYGAEAHLGNYDQCIKSPWVHSHPTLRTQYCLLEVKGDGVDEERYVGPFEDAKEYYRRPDQSGRRFINHGLAVCLPAVCSPSSVIRLARYLLDMTHLPGTVYLDPRDCETAGQKKVVTAGYQLFWGLIGVLIATSVYSTLFSEKHAKQSLLGTITNSFCIRRNYKSLFTISQSEVKVMHGMRFLTAASIVGIHEFFYQVLTPIANGLDLNKILNSPVGLSLLHVDVIVDTFFAMSGLLVVRGLLTGRQTNVFYALLKRYFRLIGPYALVILYLITTAIYMDDGPFWGKANRDEIETCSKYWWKSLLMINTETHSLCHVVTWYLSCDFQLAILVTLLFCIHKRSKRLCFAIFAIIFLATTMHLGYSVYWRRLDILAFTFKTISLKRDFTDMPYTYSKSHVRAGAYLVGAGMGYILATYKPAEHRNTLGKTRSIIIGSVSLITMYLVLTLGTFFVNKPYNAFEAAVVVATNRILWATALCCLIGVCEYGRLPLVSGILSWPGFVPLSKLSYCLYLLHPLFIQLYKFNARSPVFYHLYFTVLHTSGALVLSLVGSLILHLILEAPLINISNELFTEKKIPLDQNGAKTDINQNRTVICTTEKQNNCDKTKMS